MSFRFLGPQVSKFPLSYMFGMCSLFLAVAALCQRWLERLSLTHSYDAVKASTASADIL